VRVDAVVEDDAEVLVEEGCCAPWQTYCLSSSAGPSAPLPKKSEPEKTAQEKGIVDIGP